MTPADELHVLARRLTRTRGALGAFWVGCLGLFGYGIGALTGAPVPFVAGGVVAGLVLLWREARQRVTPMDVARHLDRVVPALEESTGLLLADAQALAPVARLQRARVEARWAGVAVSSMIPRGRTRLGVALGLLAAVVGVALAAAGRSPGVGAAVAPILGVPARPELRALELTVTPPAYTGSRAHVERGEELVAEEGAALAWRVRAAGPVTAARLAFTGGDTLPLIRDGADWVAHGTARAPALVQVLLADSAGVVAGDERRLAIRPDRPPVVTLVQPTGRTEFLPGRLAPVRVEVLATDDYGVADVVMAVTLASGKGEAVKFERKVLPFAARTRRPEGGLRLTATLDLAALGLGPGDELYFHAEATDRRTPSPGRGRSETAFLVITDTSARPRADFTGMVLAAEPEYFRSQRQIIIDTEKLLADHRRLAAGEFNARSNEIGADQGLLRLRYGQFLGEEFEENAVPGAGHEEHDAPPVPAAEPDAPADPRAGLEHRHDDPENATLLGQSVKVRLKAAVNAMWQAELHLRVHEPERALPFEYRALELLKSVQQEARVYVQRVGFEPPPIEVARLRLTGKLDDVVSRTRTGSVEPADSLAALHAALVAATGAATAGEARAAAAGLVPAAVADPRLLAVLHAFRRLADSLAGGGDCAPCREDAARRLYPLLPVPAPVPVPATGARSSLAERYLRRLEAAPR